MSLASILASSMFVAVAGEPRSVVPPVDLIVKTCPSADVIRGKVKALVGERLAAWPEDHYFMLVPSRDGEPGWFLEEHLGPEVSRRDGPLRGACDKVEDAVAIMLADRFASRPAFQEEHALVSAEKTAPEEPGVPGGHQVVRASPPASPKSSIERRWRIGVELGALETVTPVLVDTWVGAHTDRRVWRKARLRGGVNATFWLGGKGNEVYSSRYRLLGEAAICTARWRIVNRVTVDVCGVALAGVSVVRTHDFLDRTPGVVRAASVLIAPEFRAMWYTRKSWSIGLAVAPVFGVRDSVVGTFVAFRTALILAFAVGPY